MQRMGSYSASCPGRMAGGRMVFADVVILVIFACKPNRQYALSLDEFPKATSCAIFRPIYLKTTSSCSLRIALMAVASSKYLRSKKVQCLEVAETELELQAVKLAKGSRQPASQLVGPAGGRRSGRLGNANVAQDKGAEPVTIGLCSFSTGAGRDGEEEA